MSFRISKLHLKRFRNHHDSSFELDPNLTVLYGRNAVGKTSVIEAVQMLCEGASFRKPTFSEMIEHGNELGSLTLEAYDPDVTPWRTRAVELVLEPHKRTYTVNGKEVSLGEGIAGEIPVIVFSPDHLALIKNSASRRREEIDGVNKQLSKNYARLCREYTKTLKGRNRLLNEGYYNNPTFEAWDDQLVVVGSALYLNRARLLEKLQILTQIQHRDIDPTTTLAIEYTNNWGATPDATKEELAIRFHEALREYREQEIARRVTLVGPHRDDMIFSLDGHDARTFGSQGQQRTIALAWKLAQLDLVEQIAGIRPLLLLDDVMSELDQVRRDALMRRVGNDTQTIITTTNTHYFEPDLMERALLIELGEGESGAVGKSGENEPEIDTPGPTKKTEKKTSKKHREKA
ncbi:MAG: DNA replication and repair protein RecF [Coriobacteriia bacterium]|nr:DNA replication and repair protein RecF [Coriobacteriia bacterium]